MKKILKQFKPLNIGKIENVEKYMPIRPSRNKHCYVNDLCKYCSSVNKFVNKVNKNNEQLQIKREIIENETKNRLNQYDFVHVLDDAIKQDVSTEITNLLQKIAHNNYQNSVEIYAVDERKMKKILKRKVKSRRYLT
jgi:hypothetical protein